MSVQVAMPGSCGELVQGIIDGINFHITCPINRYSRITAMATKDGSIMVPDGLDKTAAAAKKTLELMDISQGVHIDIKSDLPLGKGMASSTADITATVVAISELFERSVSEKEIADIAISIEPTDGVFFDGIVAFDHLEGRMLNKIGNAPPLEIIVLEPAESLDTVTFNQKKQRSVGAEELLIKGAFQMAVQGIRSKDPRLVGKAATISSILNQRLLKKHDLNDLIDICKRNGGLGVNVAHSGTVMGVLVDLGYGGRLLQKILHYLPRQWKAYVVNLIDGGPILETRNLRLETRKIFSSPLWERV